MISPVIKPGIALLAWKAPETLARTLDALSVIPADFFQDRVIFFQEISDEDRAVAKKYGFRAEGNDANQGIREGIKSAISCCQADVVLFLECDCLLYGDLDNVVAQLNAATQSIVTGQTVTVRFRHTLEPGCDFLGVKKFSRYWPVSDGSDSVIKFVRRLIRPSKANRLIGHAMYAVKHPEDAFPNKISKLSDTLYLFDSSVSAWTNQSVMVNKEWFLNTLIPYAESHPTSRMVNGFPDLEKEVNCKWWRNNKFKLGQSVPGVFTHHRSDRPEEDEKTLIH